MSILLRGVNLPRLSRNEYMQQVTHDRGVMSILLRGVNLARLSSNEYMPQLTHDSELY